MTIYRLVEEQQKFLSACPEIYPGLQLGFLPQLSRHCLVLSCRIAVVLDAQFQSELDGFFADVWRPIQPLTQPPPTQRQTLLLYENWIAQWGTIAEVEASFAPRSDVVMLASNPAPPPNRITLTPGAPHGRGQLPNVAAHLPFSTQTEDREVFYRWEAFPSSRRIHQSSNSVDPWTFASPQSEVAFAPTGFAAVARAALPSFFPAVFRWELQPQPGTSILCGAVVPMFGQAGGGVEVCFDQGANNVGPIANQVIIQPL